MQKDHSFVYHEYDSPEELASDDRALLSQAGEALNSSYSPYSEYKVGAALRLLNGETYSGSNQENMAFPSSLCAERVACFAAASSSPNIPFSAIAITARSSEFTVSKAVTPCGSCRQALLEYENLYGNPIRVIMRGETGKVLVVESIKDLLPFSFLEEALQKKKTK